LNNISGVMKQRDDLVTKIDLDKLFSRVDKQVRGYHDEILMRMDQVIGELERKREDREFEKYDVRTLKETVNNHEKRITKIEHTH